MKKFININRQIGAEGGGGEGMGGRGGIFPKNAKICKIDKTIVLRDKRKDFRMPF